MSENRLWTLSLLLLVAIVSLCVSDARACSATSQDVFLVGNKTADSACTHSTIQAAVSAATCAAGTKILLTDEVSYKGQQILIQDRNVSLIARAPGVKCGTASAVCGTLIPCPTSPLQTIEGNIRIRGSSNVMIQYLTITKGTGVSVDHSGGNYGGAIDYLGTGDLNLVTSDIVSNSANIGGGIAYTGSGKLNLSSVFLFDNHATNGGGGGIAFVGSSGAELHINAGTEISSNTSTADGGGVFIGGDARLFMIQNNSIIYFNEANSNHVAGSSASGGGIFVSGPASAEIASPGKYNLGAIYENKAVNGGGIAIVAGQNGAFIDASVRLFNIDATHPVRISNNTATSKGGGVYLRPYLASGFGTDESYAQICGANFRIDNNLALNGAAIYSDEEDNAFIYHGSGVVLGLAGCGGPESVQSLGGVACTLGADCNLIDGNIASQSSGAMLLAQDDSNLTLNHVVMRGNEADYMIRVIGTGISDLENALIVDNHAHLAIISAEHDSASAPNAPSRIDSCTIANNTVDGSYVIRNGLGLTLTNSIIDVAATATLDYSGDASNLHVSYTLVDDNVGLPADPTITVGVPTFVDAASGDYRLRYSRAGGVTTKSLGLDYAPAIVGDDRDVRSAPHDQNLAGVADIYGPRDLGAIEMQNYADRVFIDTFGDDVMLAY